MKELFFGEIKKNVKRSALIGVGVALLVLLVLTAIMYNFLQKTIKEIISDAMNEEQIQGWEDRGYYLSEEDLDQLIATAEATVSETEQEYKNDKTLYGKLFTWKNTLRVLKYAKANGYYNKDVRILGVNYGVSELSAEGFLQVYSSLAGVVLLIYGVVLASGIFANEYKTGTIKLVLSRPIKKNSLTTAKLLTVYATLTAFYLVAMLIAFVYGAIAFGSNGAKTVLYAFNNMTAGKSTLGAFAFADVFMTLVQILVTATISFALGTLTKKYAVGLLALIIVFLNLGGLLSDLGVTAFLLSNAFDVMCFFGQGTVVRNGNFFLSMAVIVFWTAAAITSTYLVVKKRDVF